MDDTEKESVNKFLYEWMGPCFEKWEDGSVKKFIDIDFFTWPGFGFLWNKAKESEEWPAFVWQKETLLIATEWEIYIRKEITERILSYINPEVFPAEWAKFLGWGKEWEQKNCQHEWERHCDLNNDRYDICLKCGLCNDEFRGPELNI